MTFDSSSVTSPALKAHCSAHFVVVRFGVQPSMAIDGEQVQLADRAHGGDEERHEVANANGENRNSGNKHEKKSASGRFGSSVCTSRRQDSAKTFLAGASTEAEVPPSVV